MPIIYQLVKTLTPRELEMLNGMPLQERERDVLLFMERLNTKVFPSSTVCNKLNLKSSHLDKINSILFRKVIECLAGNDIYQQVQFLDQKNGMWNASLRLLKHHEQQADSELDPLESFRFYKFYFEWTMSIANAIATEEEINHLAKKVLEHCPKAVYDETQLWIKIVLFRKDVNASTTRADYTNPEIAKELQEKLHDLIYEAEAINSAYCLYKIKLTGIFFSNLTKNFTQSRIYISDINDLFQRVREAFSESEVLTAQWHYAQILFFSSQFEESFQIYTQLFEQINVRETMRWYVFIAEYFQICLVTGHYDIAEQLCRDYFKKFFDDKNGSFYLSALIQCVKLLIHTNKMDDAKIKIDELGKLTSKTSSLQFQFALRELGCAYLYLTGDYKTALQLAEKNLKFMRSKRIHYLIPEYTYHARLTKAIIKQKQRHNPLTEEENRMMDEMQKGTMAQYGILLKRLESKP
jgi:hypothetical protein